jgi:hypothetical protein
VKRLILLVGIGIGYVLGSRAGREQYRKIKTTASKTWQSPAVRNAAEKVETFVGDKAPALGGVAHTVLSGGADASSGSTGSGANGSPKSAGANGSPKSAGANGAPSPDGATGLNLGDDLKMDTDLGTEGERPA